MIESSFVRITPETEPRYRDLISHVSEEVWPEFMLHDPIANRCWDGLFENFPSYQFALLDSGTSEIAGIANSVPLHWQGSLEHLPARGWDWAVVKSREDHFDGVEPNLHCALQVAIKPAYQGRGLSRIFLSAMRDLTRSQGFPALIAPVRPSLKSAYPLTPIERYIEWKTSDGLPFDPWLRIHVRAGARIIKPCQEAMRIAASVAEWEDWTGMRFFDSGPYVVPGALVPLTIDVDQDAGTYIEPNVWVVHRMA